VHILGWIGGDRVAPHLRAAAGHPEARVRREVVAALALIPPGQAHPILFEMLAAAEPSLFTAIVQQFSHTPDDTVAEKLLELLRAESFRMRSEDERFSVYRALSSQGDRVLPALEDEFQRGGFLARGLEPHWQAVARCIARIGSPAALEVLARGIASRRAGVRAACEQARARLEHGRD